MKDNITKRFIFSDFSISLLLLILSVLPRLITLGSIPSGIHGDEGWIGLLAREIIKVGPIPLYHQAATGIPTGVIYVTAFFFRFFKENIFWLRFSFAIFGILTVPLFYLFLRLFFAKKIAVLTTFAFNFSLMSIHYSRVAFIVILVPFFQLLTLISIVLGRRKKSLGFIFLAGIFAGLGLYSYHPFILFFITIIILLIIDIYLNKFTSFHLKKLLLFLTISLSINLPMINVIKNQPNIYLGHIQSYNLLNEVEVKKEENIKLKLTLIVQKGFNNIYHFFFGKKVDYVDGFGKYYNFNYSHLILFFLGIYISLIQKRKIHYFLIFSLLFFLNLPFLTFEGTYRRGVLTLTYFYFFYAVAISYILAKRIRNVLTIAIVSLILFESFNNLSIYFRIFPFDQETKYVYTFELTKAGLILNEIVNKDQDILFFSSRWSCEYETLRFINNYRKCQNRSSEFGNFDLNAPSNNVIFVFLNDYISIFKRVKKKYPNGEEFYIKDNLSNKTVGIIYKI